jgi:hypothetical protein
MTLAEFIDRIGGSPEIAQAEMYSHNGNPIVDFSIETSDEGETYIQFEEEED